MALSAGLVWGYLTPSGAIIMGPQGFVENLQAVNDGGDVLRLVGEQWVVVR